MKTTLLTLCAIGFCCLCVAQNPEPSASTASTAQENWTVKGNLPLDQFVIQSHRGAGVLAPENTIEAFELAWKLRTVPEADLRTTSDGVIVAFHDANFKRVVKSAGPELQNKGVADITFAELSKLDVGAWKGDQFLGRRVSRISDVFQRMRDNSGRNLYLDIKNVDLRRLADEVRQHNVSRQVILASTVYDIISEWKRLVPESQTLHWMGGGEADLKQRLDKLRAAEFAGITQLQLHVRLNTNNASAEPFNLSREFIRSVGTELRGRGILLQALPWGVAERNVYHQLLDLGIASFATDHPDVTVQAVREYYADAPPSGPKGK